jgi:hypothetical protein
MTIHRSIALVVYGKDLTTRNPLAFSLLDAFEQEHPILAAA